MIVCGANTGESVSLSCHNVLIGFGFCNLWGPMVSPRFLGPIDFVIFSIFLFFGSKLLII
jgi:hypothetical protein